MQTWLGDHAPGEQGRDARSDLQQREVLEGPEEVPPQEPEGLRLWPLQHGEPHPGGDGQAVRQAVQAAGGKSGFMPVAMKI